MRIHKHIILLLFLLIVGIFSVMAQVSEFIDSLNKRLKTANDSEKVILLSSLSRYYLHSSFSYSMELALKAKTIADSLNNDYLRAEALNRIGTVHYYMRNYEKATAYILQALRIREGIGDSASIAYSYTNLALIYSANKDFDKAIEYNKKSIELKERLGLDRKVGANYNNMSVIYSYMGDLEKSLVWIKKTLEFAKKYHLASNIQDAYLNLGGVYHDMKEYDKAEEYYKISLRMADSLVDTSGIVMARINLSALYLDKQEPEKALTMLRKVSPLITVYAELHNLRSFYGNLAEYYQKKGDLKKAWEYLKEYSHLDDSIKSNLSRENITNMQSEYEAQELEYKIKTLEKDRVIKEMTLKKEKRRIIAFLTFFILVILLILNIIYAIRKMDKIKQDLDQKNKNLEKANEKLMESERQLNSMIRTKDKFFSIIAHDLINPFQPLLGLSELLVTDIDKLSDEEIKKYASLIKESAMRSYNLLSNLLKWTQSQTGRLSYNPEDIYLSALIDEIISFYKENARIKNIHLLNHVDKDIIVYSDRELLGAIIRNLLSNAIKFTGRNGYVKIEAHKKGHFIEVSVEDNGVGIEKNKLENLFRLESTTSTRGTDNEEGSGLGLILCKEFVEKNGGEIRVKSKKGKGTTFYFTIHLAEETHKTDRK